MMKEMQKDDFASTQGQQHSISQFPDFAQAKQIHC
jgi:hypothetical protein